MRIAVVSGKGGSGISSVTAALVSLSESVIAVDCDVDASNLPLLFSHEVLRCEDFASGTELLIDGSSCAGCGKCVESCAYGALVLGADGRVRVSDLLCEGCGLCQRLCPTGAISIGILAESKIYTSRFSKGILIHGDLCPGDDNSGKMVNRIREIADQEMEEAQIGLQILDGPPGIGCPVLSTLTGVDKVVLVCEPTLSGISDMKRIHALSRNYTEDISVIINKYDIHPAHSRKIEEACAGAGIPVIARLPFDRIVVDAQVHCQSIIDYAPESACSLQLRQAADLLF